MATTTPQENDLKSRKSVISWLLDSDPSIRWQVMRDLTYTPAEVVAAERERVAAQGWGAQLLALQNPDGTWGDGTSAATWESTLYTLLLLQQLGLDPTSEQARQAVGRVRDNVSWGPQFGDAPFFEGETEPCINGGVLTLGGYFGEVSDRLLDRLLSEQLEDGGWNCEAPRSQRSSFHSTICVLEGLAAYEQSNGATATVIDARVRGQEYLLERRLFRSRSSGAVIDQTWTRFSFPTGWHYDVLRGLEYLRSAGVEPDERLDEAVALVAQQQHDNGRWPCEHPHREPVLIDMEGGPGTASRWNTLRALRVLDWFAARA